MKMFNAESPYHAMIKHKCRFLYNIVPSENLLCGICKEFAEKGLRGYSDCA